MGVFHFYFTIHLHFIQLFKIELKEMKQRHIESDSEEKERLRWKNQGETKGWRGTGKLF